MKTWGALKAEIFDETNTEGEDFVSAGELLVWANDAKDAAEAEIVSIYDKYMETEDFLPLVAGVALVDPPTGIYANKVTGFFFNDGNEKYEIKKLKRKSDILLINDNDRYRYDFINDATNGIQIKIYPTPRETAAEIATMHFIRESNAIEDDDSLMDIPIADAFIKQYIIDKIKEVEFGPAVASGPSQALVIQKNLFIEALNEMTPDESSGEIEMDLGFYEDVELL